MHAAGLIRYAKGSKISTKAFLYNEQEVASCCEWVHDSVQSNLLYFGWRLPVILERRGNIADGIP